MENEHILEVDEVVNEYDFTTERRMLFEIQSKTLSKAFERRNVSVHVMKSRDEIYPFLQEFISQRSDIKDIAFSDGATLYELDLFNWINNNYSGRQAVGGGNYSVNQPLKRGKNGHYAVFGDQPRERMKLPYDEWKQLNDEWYEGCRKSLTSDLQIISANGITLNGEVISIDGLGNRVSGMIFGPRHVVCIVGRNKIYPNEDVAMSMIRNHVVPLTYLRHINKHIASFNDVPCVKLGKCVDCMHEYSSCRNIVVMRGQIKQHRDRFHLVLINEDLGF